MPRRNWKGTLVSLANPDAQWSANEDRTYAVGEKTGEVRLNAEFSMFVYKPTMNAPSGRFLLVSLAGTSVSPTKDHMEKDQTDIRGFFTESVDLQMGFDEVEHSISIRQDSPETTGSTGSVTSSISTSFNGGFFGSDLTGGAGLSISNSISASLQDFSIINHSDNHRAHHIYQMTMTKEGSPYETPNDLLDMSTSGQLSGCPLFHLSPRAQSNLPIVSQVLFWTPQEITDTRTLGITITHVTRKVEKTFKVFSVDVNNWKGSTTANFTFDIDFGQVK